MATTRTTTNLEHPATTSHRHMAQMAVSSDNENDQILARHFGYAAGSPAMDRDPIIGVTAENMGEAALLELIASLDTGHES